MKETSQEKLATAKAELNRATLIFEAAERRAHAAKAQFKRAKKLWKQTKKAAKHAKKLVRQADQKVASLGKNLPKVKPAKAGKAKPAKRVVRPNRIRKAAPLPLPVAAAPNPPTTS